MKKVNFSISEIIEIYNTIPNILYNKVTKVNLESYQNSSIKKLLIEAKNGNYWIIKTEDEKEWLLPSNKLTVNQFNHKSIQSFFEFKAYDNSENRDFILVEAATVSLLPNASKKEWKLETAGILNFDPDFPAAKMRSQLQQIQNERDQYKSELEKIKQEKEQLTSQVAQLASDSLKDIRANLVTKDELNQHIKTISELQQIQRNNTEKIYKLEQYLKNNEQIKEFVRKLTEKFHQTIETVTGIHQRLG
jgi:ElaB/YqjD/DUF883 family membrane-anchored ribosome-binding protein